MWCVVQKLKSDKKYYRAYIPGLDLWGVGKTRDEALGNLAKLLKKHDDVNLSKYDSEEIGLVNLDIL